MFSRLPYHAKSENNKSPGGPGLELPVGIEPTVSSLPRTCFTAKLRQRSGCLERVAGIEPATSAWKAETLPLCNTRSVCWWAGLDLNQRSAFARRIYSPVPLTTRPPTHTGDDLDVTADGKIPTRAF